MRFGGQGGEIFRGYLYPKDGARRMSLHEDDAAPALERRTLKRMGRVPWNDPTLADAFRSRFHQTVQGFQDISRNAFDVLDMFYLSSVLLDGAIRRLCRTTSVSALRSKAARWPRWLTACQLQSAGTAGFRKRSSGDG